MDQRSTRRFLHNIAENDVLRFRLEDPLDGATMLSVADMLRYIEEASVRIQSREDLGPFIGRMVVHFISSSNALAGLSISTASNTTKLLQNVSRSVPKVTKDSVVNMKAAMDHAYKTFCGTWTPNSTERGKFSVAPIRVEMILEIHRLIMNGELHARQTRDHTEVMNMRLTASDHHEQGIDPPTGEMGIAGLQAICDKVSTLIYPLVGGEVSEAAALFTAQEVVKLSAWVHFMLLDLHAFQDGNGRVARLVGNYLLMTLSPFPIPIFFLETTESFAAQRSRYIEALGQARRDSRGAPVDLTLMLLDNMCRCFFRCSLPADGEKLAADKLDEAVHDFILSESKSSAVNSSPTLE
tara:strand:+ start:212 stop:1270 length:1059 start_codon:yes stop_codon:yes gene_type:complete